MATRSRAIRPATGARGAPRPMSLSERAATLRPRAGTPVDRFRPGGATAIVESLSSRVSVRQMDGWLLFTLVALCGFGLVMLYSASEAVGYALYKDPNYFFWRQAIVLLIGLAGAWWAAHTDYHRWQRWTKWLVLISLLLLFAVLVPGVGVERLGARRWLSFKGQTLQPSVFATFMCIVAFSRWLVDRGPGIRSWRIVRDYALLLFGLLLLVILEKDLGSTLILAGIGVVLVALAGARKRHLFVVAGLLLGLGYMAIMLESYRATRVANFRDPFADPLNTGYQMVHSLYALGSGGFSGVGLGNSIEKFQWLPESHTDFIFAIIGEELGLVGTVAVIGGFFVLAWRGVRTSLRAPDSFGALVAAGITAWICVQAFLNIAAVTNVVPTTGVPLPFISYGGTSLLFTLVAVGILCNISAQGRRQGVSRRAHVDRWRGDGRAPDSRAGGRAGAQAR